MTLNTLQNALNEMLQDMDIAEHYSGYVEQVNEETFNVIVHSRHDDYRRVAIAIRYLNNFSDIEPKIVEINDMKPIFAELLLENLVIQIKHDFYL